MTFTGELYPYQVDDKDYILKRGNLLLAYGQGTGKTVMTIAAIEEAMDLGIIVQPGLVVCMASLKHQWAQAIHQWTGGYQERDPRTGLYQWTGGQSTPLVVDSGVPPKKRYEIYERAMNWQTEPVDYIILGYEQVVNDWKYVQRLPRGFVVLDEATAVKSFTSQRSRRVKRLDSPIRLALTGTPIENGKPEELFSIMQWVDEDVLGRWDIFDRAFIVRDGFGGVKRYRNIPVFNEALEPAMRRRTRKDAEVAPFFPEVDDEQDPIIAELDPAGRKLYKHIAAELAADLREAMQTVGSFDLGSLYGFASQDGDGIRGRIAQKRMALQMLVDHPQLLHVSAGKFENYMETGAKGGSAYIAELVATGLLDKVTKTPKMDAAVEWLEQILETDERNKVVVFATYVPTLALFQERLKVDSVVFHGGMSEKQKAQAMGRFKQDPSCRVFLSSDAGGYGIDLPEANYLLNYSFPEKWGTTDQRETRIIRASSAFDTVQIRRITVAGSIDVMKYNRLVMKGRVAGAFLEGKGVNAKGQLANDVGGLLTFLTTEAGELTV